MIFAIPFFPPLHAINSNKTTYSTAWLFVKPHLYASALKFFEGSNISITQEGRPYLGSPIGTSSFVRQFVIAKVAGWVSEIEELSLNVLIVLIVFSHMDFPASGIISFEQYLTFWSL